MHDPSRAIRQMVRAASLPELVAALVDDESAGLEIFDYPWPSCWCPRCQRDFADKALVGPAATFEGYRWSCSRCRAVGTRYSLEHQVLDDPDALDRLVDLLDAGEAA